MVATTDTIKINNFGGRLNFRDDELNLEIGETPKAQNIEIVRKTGLQKKAGYAPIFNKLPSNVSIHVIKGTNHITILDQEYQGEIRQFFKFLI